MAFSWIELDGVLNMRDLVGTRLAGGDRIAPHRLVRSDNLNFLTDHDVAVLSPSRSGWSTSSTYDRATSANASG